MSERLKEIKKELELDWSDISYVVNQDDVKWLINRVEELEDFKRNAEQLYKNYHLSAKKSVAEKEELREQNQRYREALEEILAESYEEAGLHPDTNMQLETFIAKTARKALEGEE